MRKARRSAGRTASRRWPSSSSFWLIDDLYAAPYGRGVLNNLTGTPQYLSWLARDPAPPHGRRDPRDRRRHRQHLRPAHGPAHGLRGRRKRSPAPARAPQPFPAHAQRGGAAHRSRGPRGFRRPGGLLRHGALPQRPGIPGRSRAHARIPARRAEAGRRADRAGTPRPASRSEAWIAALGHKRRYSAAEARRLLESEGFHVDKVYSFNKAGAPPWWAYSRVLGRRHINKPVLKIFDKTVWVWRSFDGLMPWPGLSLIAGGPPAGRRGAARGISRAPRDRLPSLLPACRLNPPPSACAISFAGFAAKRILVIGDLMLDEFVWGKVSRISPEAPVPVVNVTGESYYPGGAANVARNVREFTAQTAVMGVAGADGHGRRLVRLLEECGLDTSGVLENSSASTTVKTRIIARNQQVVRVDRERVAPLDAEANAPRHRTPRARRERRRCHHRGRLRQGLPHPASRRSHLPGRARTRQNAGRGPASLHIALLARSHRHQTQPRRSLRRRGSAARRPGHARALRSRLARRGPTPARSLAARQPAHHAGRTRHAAAPVGRPAVSHPHARAKRFRRLRRRRHGHRGFYPGPLPPEPRPWKPPNWPIAPAASSSASSARPP